jgi:hypothetical protein
MHPNCTPQNLSTSRQSSIDLHLRNDLRWSET